MRRLAAALALLAAACAPGGGEGPYGTYTDELLAIGRLRADRAPADAPFSDADLARNFVRIALAVEDFGRQKAAPRPLRRWEGPIRYDVIAVGPEDDRATDRMMRRLARLTGLRVVRSAERPNLLVVFADRDGREAMARHLDRMRNPSAGVFAESLRVSDAVSPCLGVISPGPDYVIRAAYVIIKDEARGILRQSCIEEELAQVMGLTNDHPEVRPSIFNDDEEFAYLTEHDEYLLRILYHPALRPGMTAREVVPLLPGIIAGLRRQGAS